MSRFLLFGGDHYYPSGGGLDLLSGHDTLDAAVGALPEHPADVGSGGYGCQWAHVFDVDEQRVVVAWSASYGSRDPRPGFEVSRWVQLDEQAVASGERLGW